MKDRNGQGRRCTSIGVKICCSTERFGHTTSAIGSVPHERNELPFVGEPVCTKRISGDELTYKRRRPLGGRGPLISARMTPHDTQNVFTPAHCTRQRTDKQR